MDYNPLSPEVQDNPVLREAESQGASHLDRAAPVLGRQSPT